MDDYPIFDSVWDQVSYNMDHSMNPGQYWSMINNSPALRISSTYAPNWYSQAQGINQGSMSTPSFNSLMTSPQDMMQYANQFYTPQQSAQQSQYPNYGSSEQAITSTSLTRDRMGLLRNRDGSPAIPKKKPQITNNATVDTARPETEVEPTQGGDKSSFEEKFNKSTFGKNFEAWDAAANAANSLMTGIVGDKMFGGPKGHLTQAIDEGWDTAANVAEEFGPLGKTIGLGMKGLNIFNKSVNAALGKAALDNMTTTDAVLNNPLLGWNVGLINALGGANSDTITKNEEAFAQVGSAYGGSNTQVDDALNFSGKRYGAFSSGARKDANALIADSRRQQNMVTDISDTSKTRFDLTSSMSAINGNARAFNMQGGYQQNAVHVGRHGLKLEKLEEAKAKVVEYKKQLNEKTTSTEIILTQEIDEFKDGGAITCQSTYIELVVEVPEFQEGGSINVIPEGALHARLHHMEGADNLTKKGIPVVSEKEGGELEQQAEIEREEIILRLEVTKTLEELQKKYYNDKYTQKEKDEFALEAGKLLTYELLQNTQDNTGLLNAIQ